MKKIIYSQIHFLQFFIVAIMILFFSCEQDEVNPPVITEIRNYAASPDDTLITSLNTGQWVVILGRNLSEVTQVHFGSTPATINQTLLMDGSIVVQVPSIPFQSVPRDEVNVVTAVNGSGVASFEINITGAPIVSYIRNYSMPSDDEIVNAIFPDQQINLVGYNLKGATTITFQGVEADLTSVVYTDSSAIVQVPADLSGADVSLANMINYTTQFGTVAFPIRIVGPPLITSISCENPSEGSTVNVRGYNFVSVEGLTFAGEIISTFNASADGGSIEFIVPTLTASGPVVITTPAGTFTTIFNVNDVSTGALCNFDDISPIGWGGSGATIGDNDTEFPGNKGKYGILQNGIVGAWDWGAWGGGRIIILDNVKWLPAANDDDPLDSWAVKFEINVPEAWNGNSLFVSSEHNDFRITYEPWKSATGQTSSFTTNGWQTITLPLSLFRKGWGGTDAPANLGELLGNTESCGFAIQTMNISNANSATGLKAAVDNIRVIKIK